MNERTLASVQKVTDLLPIEGADRIELARVEGWKVIVQKGRYSVGDLLVYFEIDSVLPPDARWDDDLGRYGNRVRTMKMRGVYSQGYCLPLDLITKEELKKAGCKKLSGFSVVEGVDLTDALGVKKYEPNPDNQPGHKNPSTYRGIRKWAMSLVGQQGYLRDFPHFCQKTDETRVNKLGALIAKMQGEPFIITEKLDGSSMTVYYKDGKFGVCSRNKELLTELPAISWWKKLILKAVGLGSALDNREKDNPIHGHFWKTALELKLPEKMRWLGRNLAIQGELVGPNICGNKYKLSSCEFYVFYIYNLDTKRYLDPTEALEVATSIGLSMVPHLDWVRLDHSVDDLVTLASGKSKLSDVLREGIVLRSEQFYNGDPISFKSVCPKWLEKYKE